MRRANLRDVSTRIRESSQTQDDRAGFLSTEAPFGKLDGKAVAVEDIIAWAKSLVLLYESKGDRVRANDERRFIADLEAWKKRTRRVPISSGASTRNVKC